MEIEKNKRKENMNKGKKISIILAVVLLLLIVAVSFAYYFSILKGENINTAKMSGASIVYTEPETGTETIQMSDYKGIKDSTPYEFTVTGKASGTTTLNYAIYLEELSGNTVNKSNIKYYLTDANNIPIGKMTTAYSDGSDVLITPTGEEKLYKYYTDVVIKDESNKEKFSGKITEDPYDYLLLYYTKQNIVSDENFYVEIGEKCHQVIYDEIEDTITIKEDIEESSNCAVSYDSILEETGYKITRKSDNKVLYTATFSDSYIEFSDSNNTRYDGYITGYIGQVLNAQINSSFYVKTAYTVLNPNNELEEVGSYCSKYTVDSDGSYEEEIVDNSNCTDVYTEVLGVTASTLGDMDSNTPKEYSSLSNIIEIDSIDFEDGKATFNGKGLKYLEQRAKNPLRTYKLRYWVSSTATDSTTDNNETATEVTPTTEENKHTVNFGSSRIFKFKVNVYAYQENLE